MKEKLFDSLFDGFNFTAMHEEMDAFLKALNKNGLKIVEFCDCEPFQPCLKCAKKTEWLPLKEMKVDVEYWLLDKKNVIGKGFLKNDIRIEYILKDCPDNFGAAVMFAEIKPPTTP